MSLPLMLRGVTILFGIICLGLMADISRSEHRFTKDYRVERFNLAVIIIALILTIVLIVLSFLGRNKSGPMVIVDVCGNLLCLILISMGWMSYLFNFQQVNDVHGYYKQTLSYEKNLYGYTGYKYFRAKAISLLVFEFFNIVVYFVITLFTTKAPSHAEIINN